MLFCHPQPESYHQHSASYIREALAPFLKDEEARLTAESVCKRSSLQVVLCAATSPAVKQQEETLTYLNQEHRAGGVPRPPAAVYGAPAAGGVEVEPTWRPDPGYRYPVVRGDPGAPFTPHASEHHRVPLGPCEEGFCFHPGTDSASGGEIPFSHTGVNCISTEFTPRKHGGEKGVPFRIQVDTFSTNEHGEYMEHVSSSSCQVKVFKPKGADRKLKTDREKIDKKALQDREKYQLSHESTVLKECSPWPDALNLSIHSSSTPSPVYHSSPTSCTFTDGNCSPTQPGELLMPACSDHLLPSSSLQDTQQWLQRHRFSPFCRLFCSFAGRKQSGSSAVVAGADLLRMSREDLVQICGPADGIRLFNTMKGRCIQPRLTMYVCQHQARPAVKPGAGDIYHALYLKELTLMDLSEKIAMLYSLPPQQITHIYRQKPSGIHVLVSDEMVQNFREETSFILSTLRDETTDGYRVVLK
ncbi:transcription factor CP2-like protein 1 isoform X2 [Notothenia coriiceps]|uniref:Transcription factor CP2-like protein 1 isoform X2 n=1 Tax=Notothenia coriiceps TaxID=8208 RepID=A0A6I9P1A6_9TELE|nr:PREDICTED: transcription factor CP2-like protein 1 isoform X2 [Notothenia coriiceps]